MKGIPTCIAVRTSIFQSGLVKVLHDADRTHPSVLDETALDGDLGAVGAGGCTVVVLGATDQGWERALAMLERTGVASNRVLVAQAVRSASEAADLLALNVAGCVESSDTPEALVEKVVAAAEGDWRRSRRDLFEIVQQVRNPGADAPPLSRLDLETLSLLAKGFNNRRIAQQLTLADGTVRNRVSALYRQIEVESRSQAVVWAWTHGFGTGEDGESARM